ncbi:MAG TPA: DUF4097 family beta strand repeat-containing protein [Pseudohongiella sp.]|nr:DUF4097 family beta strand repeat-containing protein [Pseudohongiella sp.]
MKLIKTVVLASCLISPVAFGQNCEFSRNINFDVDATGLARVELDVGAGYLNIRPSENDQVSVRARACASTRGRLESMDLVHERRGDRLVIDSEIDDNVSFSIFRSNDYAYIDVDMSVPAGLLLDIEDGSGDIRIANVSAELRIEDGSGDINILRHTGSVRIDDGSGDIDVDGLSGALRVVDGSGDIDVRNVVGNVHIPSDGSGSIDIRDIKGDVAIDDDGSGGISVHNVSGNLSLGDTGSGRVNFDDIGGNVRMRGR